MATPVIADLNNDDRLEELVIPVSYYFDEEEYRYLELQINIYGAFKFWLICICLISKWVHFSGETTLAVFFLTIYNWGLALKGKNLLLYERFLFL